MATTLGERIFILEQVAPILNRNLVIEIAQHADTQWNHTVLKLAHDMMACAAVPNTPLYLCWSASGRGRIVDAELGLVTHTYLSFHTSHVLMYHCEIRQDSLYLFSRKIEENLAAKQCWVVHRVRVHVSDGTDPKLSLQRQSSRAYDRYGIPCTVCDQEIPVTRHTDAQDGVLYRSRYGEVHGTPASRSPTSWHAKKHGLALFSVATSSHRHTASITLVPWTKVKVT